MTEVKFIPWTRSPYSVDQAEQKAVAKGHQTSRHGSVLYVHKPGTGWLEFMDFYNHTFYRYVPTRQARHSLVSSLPQPAPSFFCESCGEVKPLDQMVVATVDKMEHTICKGCHPEVVERLLKRGHKVGAL